jgi:hypothetical protein
MWCCVGDEGWPFEVALRGRLQTATCCVIGDGIVVSDVEKARVTR